MKHLVTGGSGFLGSILAARLLAAGEEVRVLDIRDDDCANSEIEFFVGDIRDRQGVARAMRGVDVVHHHVALVPITKSGEEFYSVNVEGTRIACEEAVRAGVGAFVHMSSSAIFGIPDRHPIDDQASTTPFDAYGRSKLQSERVARKVCDSAGLRSIIIRPRTILGNGRLGIFQILFDWIREGRAIYTIGSGNNRFQFVHADDLLDACLLLLNSGHSGTYNVGTDRFGTIREALTNLIAHAGSASRVVGIPEPLVINALRVADWLRVSPLAPWHYRGYSVDFFFDVQNLLAIGWKPRFSNDEMMMQTYDWFIANHEEIMSRKTGSAHRLAVAERILGIVRRFS